MSVVIGVKTQKGIWLVADRRMVGTDGRRLPPRNKLHTRSDEPAFCVGVVGDGRIHTLLDQHIEEIGTSPEQFASDVRQLLIDDGFQPSKSQGAPTFPFGAVLARQDKLYVIDGSFAVYEASKCSRGQLYAATGIGAPVALALARFISPGEERTQLDGVVAVVAQQYPSCGDGNDGYTWELEAK